MGLDAPGGIAMDQQANRHRDYEGFPRAGASRFAIASLGFALLLNLTAWSAWSEPAQAQDPTPVVVPTPAAPGRGAAEGQPSEASADLERTGTDAWYMAAGGGLFVLVGAAFVVLGRGQKPRP